MAAGALALIAGIDIESLQREMFEAGSDLRISQRKNFLSGLQSLHSGSDFGVGQISSMN